MKLSKASSPLKQLHKTAWKFQHTFRTPRRNLPSFASTILSSGPPLQTACVTIEVAVFEPEHLIEVLTRNSLPPQYQKGTSVIAEGRQEIEDLLCAVLYDCMDFLFVPAPKPFVIYADHDEYTTFYANTRSNLNELQMHCYRTVLKKYRSIKGEDSASWRNISITLIDPKMAKEKRTLVKSPVSDNHRPQCESWDYHIHHLLA